MLGFRGNTCLNSSTKMTYTGYESGDRHQRRHRKDLTFLPLSLWKRSLCLRTGFKDEKNYWQEDRARPYTEVHGRRTRNSHKLKQEKFLLNIKANRYKYHSG